MLQRFPIEFTQVNAGNTSKKLLILNPTSNMFFVVEKKR